MQYVSRAGWGADERLRFTPYGTELLPQIKNRIQTITIHHVVSPANDLDYTSNLRALYVFHTVAEDRGDIGYHFLIDKTGTVYEGRYAGAGRVTDDRTAVGAIDEVYGGGHVGGFNAGNVGIALLSDLATEAVTPAALDSLIRVLARVVKCADIDPLSTVNYINPISGATRLVPAITTHRGWSATSCPDGPIRPLIPGVREAVGRIIS
ncbi:N-acetylmuramoyl-L-alanine amidase [Kribbella sp. NPDC055071]